MHDSEMPVYMPCIASTVCSMISRKSCSRCDARMRPCSLQNIADPLFNVQIGRSAPILSPGAAAARRFLQATFSAKFGGASPDATYAQAPSPVPGGLPAQMPNQTQMPDQAAWPSGPGLWPLGNKSRSGNNTSGGLLYSTDQQPPAWSAPAPVSAPSPPPQVGHSEAMQTPRHDIADGG